MTKARSGRRTLEDLRDSALALAISGAVAVAVAYPLASLAAEDPRALSASLLAILAAIAVAVGVAWFARKAVRRGSANAALSALRAIVTIACAAPGTVFAFSGLFATLSGGGAAALFFGIGGVALAAMPTAVATLARSSRPAGTREPGR